MNYLLRSHGFKFFELVLVTASLIIAITVVRNSTNFLPKAFSNSTSTFTLKSGWNLISVPFREYSAESLCTNYNFEEVARWVGGKWERRNCAGSDSVNFTIAPFKAFFVKEPYDGYSATFSGKQNKYNFTMASGWNSFYAASNFQKYKLASDLCTSSPDKKFAVAEVARWVFNDWNIHTCGVPFNDFPIIKGGSYFVKANAPASGSTEGTMPSIMLVTPE